MQPRSAARFAGEYPLPETRSGTASCGAQLKQDGIELAVRRMLTSDAFHDQASKALDNGEEIKLEDISLDEALERAPKPKWGKRVLRWEESLHLEDPTLDQAIARYTAEHDDGRKLCALHRQHCLTPIDMVRKDAALSEELNRLGVRLN